MTKVIAKCDGNITEHEIPEQLFTAIVADQGIKVEVPEALLIDSRKTVECMEKMSQRAWEHISTGELFQHLFNMLFRDSGVKIPVLIEPLLDGDIGVIHGCGLIVLLVESRFAGVKKVHIRTPEDHLHPKTQRLLVSVIQEIQKIPNGGEMEVAVVAE